MKITISFTGHRPHKLFGYDVKNEKNQLLINTVVDKIKLYIEEQIALHGEDTEFEFISGMALGTDIWLAQEVFKLKREYKNISLQCAVPCLNYSARWKNLDKMKYEKVLERSDKVHYVSDKEYTNHCLNDRNNYLVDSATTLFAIWDNSPSGTANCIKYAKKMKRHIIYTNPNDIG